MSCFLILYYDFIIKHNAKYGGKLAFVPLEPVELTLVETEIPVVALYEFIVPY
jgi:hypothetical protein